MIYIKYIFVSSRFCENQTNKIGGWLRKLRPKTRLRRLRPPKIKSVEIKYEVKL